MRESFKSSTRRSEDPIQDRSNLLDRNLALEISRRIRAAWGCFNKLHQLLTSRTVSIRHKRKIFISCIEPALLYASETWTLRERDCTKLVITQRRMLRRYLGVTLLDRRTNDWLMESTKAADVRERCAIRKWNFARKISYADFKKLATR